MAVSMSISAAAFERAQTSELENWVKDAGNARRVLHELLEHSTPAGPLRRMAGQRTFDRGLEVGIGCYGLGFLGVHLADRVSAIDGIDPLPRLELRLADPALQRYVDEIRGRVRYLRAMAEAIPMPTAAYDLVSCVNVVDHAKDPQAILREIDRVLRPGGLLVFGVSTLSLAGDVKWRVSRRLRPDDWHFLAHPHTYQWRAADRLVRSVRGRVLWSTPLTPALRLAGRGRMSFWLIEKASERF
jgi:SAM-dependent methyltransferase